MGTTEAYAAFDGDVTAEGEVCRQPVVEQKTQHITDSIGNIHLYPVLQHPIDAIVYEGRQRTHDAEAENLISGLFSYHAAKVINNSQFVIYNS